MFHFNALFNLIRKDNLINFQNKFQQINTKFDDNEKLSELNSLLKAKYGSSLFHLCAQYDAHEILSFYLPIAKNLMNIRDNEGKTPLHTACTYGSFKCAQEFIKNGAEINDLKRGDWTCLMISVMKTNLPIMELLLDNGADIQVTNKDGWNVLHLIARVGDINLAILMRKYIIDNNLEHLWYSKTHNGRMISHIAAIHGHSEMFEYLMDNFNLYLLHEKDQCGVTPFMDAARANCVPICKMIYEFFLKYYSKIDVDDSDFYGRTALHFSAQTNACETIIYLSKILHCNLNAKDKWQKTALNLTEKFEIKKLLIELGANTD